MKNPIDYQTMTKIMRLGPPPRLENGPDHDAVFAPFICEGEEFFQYYDSRTFVWMIGRTVPAHERQLIDLPAEGEAGDTPEDINALNKLAFMPKPQLPEEFEMPLFRGPFWHGDQKFVWFLLNLDEGWQLAISRSFDEIKDTAQPADQEDGLTA